MDQFRAPERRLFRKTRSPFAAVALAATLGFAGILAGPVASASAATTYPVATTVPVGVNPTGVAVNANTNTAYVTNILEGTVSVIDGTTKTVTTTVPVGNEPAEVAVNANTSTVYVVNQADNTVAVIDEATNTVTDTVPVGSGASGVAVNASTNTAYVTNFNGGTISVITPVTVPGVPTSISAIAGDGQASVAFTAPSDRGHSAITEYMVTATNTTTPGDGG